VDEALANVVRHAYKGQRGQPIQLTCRRLRGANTEAPAKGIEILLQDSGVALDPAKLKGRPLDEIRPGGLGLHFMRQSMDEVEFSRSQGQNQLRLVKYLAPAKPEKTQGD
jgi:anti-sigma regulatory factor (Ser/Thr protein kinase)